MKTGLILGKFLPLHLGHIALVEFAMQNCERLIILLCATNNEPIPGATRLEWLQSTFGENPRIQIEYTEYNEAQLPNTSISSREVSALWSAHIKNKLPYIDIFFSSELYGEYVAEYLNIEHKGFDPQRKQVPISASTILKNPLQYWRFITKAAQPFFVKKICISGSESTGKSTLAINLASYFNTVFVPEMAREIIGKTENVMYGDLLAIAELHARTIQQKIKDAHKTLICDTDVNITKSYANYLFNKQLEVPEWVNKANCFDLHIFLETDCPFLQDGTRLSEEERNKLSNYHKNQLEIASIPYYVITGTWQQRFEKAIGLVEKLLITS